MIIKLFQPVTGNWLLIAEQLNDPQNWDRFVPSHSADSERFKFDNVTTRLAGSQMKLTICKELLKRGCSAFQYDWNTDEEVILNHAFLVAEVLEVNIEIGEPNRKSA
jgi:hypothetical protein